MRESGRLAVTEIGFDHGSRWPFKNEKNGTSGNGFVMGRWRPAPPVIGYLLLVIGYLLLGEAAGGSASRIFPNKQ
jgi:hypothetical protein